MRGAEVFGGLLVHLEGFTKARKFAVREHARTRHSIGFHGDISGGEGATSAAPVRAYDVVLS